MCNSDDMRMMGEIGERLLSMLDEETARGLQALDANELGEVVDMVKDLAEARYYASVVEAMNAEKYGYTAKRDSRGRYMGYEDMGRRDAYGPVWDDGSMERGGAYDRYRNARMGYQHQATADNRRMMEQTADEYMKEFEDSLREIWEDADQRQRSKMKSALVSMANGLK